MATNEEIQKDIARLREQIESIMTVNGIRRRRTSLMSSELDQVLKLTEELDKKTGELRTLKAEEKRKEILQTKIKKLAKEKIAAQKETERIRRIENRLKIIMGGWLLAQFRDGGLQKAGPDGKTGITDEERILNYEKRVTAAAGNTSYDIECFRALFAVLDKHRKELLTNKDAECPRPEYPRKIPQNKKNK